MKQKILCWLFSKIYKKWLFEPHNNSYNKVIEVSGWRSALVDGSGGRKRIWPCFKILGVKFN